MMTPEATPGAVFRSGLDSSRFGIEVWRCNAGTATPVEEAVACATAHGADLLMIRLPVDAVDSMHLVERLGGRLMDTLVYFARATLASSPGGIRHISPAITFRRATPNDASACAAVARVSFSDYMGHYHTDRKLRRDEATEVYASWAEDSCRDPQLAEAVFLACENSQVLGFSTVRMVGQLAEGSLDAVHPKAQRLGLYSALNEMRLQWCREREVKGIEVATHLVNRTAQRGLQRLGFCFDRAEHTFHLWFN
jgi:GNAT superfamily N-acetyltransferase